MNKYGYFAYEDYPQNATGTATPSYLGQEASWNIIQFSGLIPDNYYDWASFEIGQFDFERPIFTADPMSRSAYISTALSNEFGMILPTPSVEVIPNGEYSGGGFAIKTYNNSYTLRITVEDIDGTRTRVFEKNDDEFYPFSYNSLTRVVFTFYRIEKFHFLKFIGFNFGNTRILSEKDLVEEPTITSHFSIDNEELELDTLDLKIRGNKDTFNIIAGEKITYSRTGIDYYVQEGHYNSDGTVSISCYDKLSLLDKNFYGILRSGDSFEEVLSTILFDGARINLTVFSTLMQNQTFSGTLARNITFREALRLMLQGNASCLKRTKNGFIALYPLLIPPSAHPKFNEHNIVSVPEYEKYEDVASVHFSKHRYSVNKVDGKVEVFNDFIPSNSIETIEFDEPVSSLSFYYVSGTDQQGDDILTPVSSDNFVVEKSGAYFRKVRNSYTQRIVATAYPYNTSYYSIDYINNYIPTVFKDNTISIKDCTVCLDANNYSDFKYYLGFISQFIKKLSFDSILEANAGDWVEISYDDKEYQGYVTIKQDRMNGVYSYEVMCL